MFLKFLLYGTYCLISLSPAEAPDGNLPGQESGFPLPGLLISILWCSLVLVFIQHKKLHSRKKQLLILSQEKQRQAVLQKHLYACIHQLVQADYEIRQLQQQRSAVSLNGGTEAEQKLAELSKRKLLTDEDCITFDKLFEQTYPGFSERLKDEHPDLTSGERRLAAFYYLKLDNQEIARITGITPLSVKKARHRLRKKLPIAQDNHDLITYFRLL